MKQCLHHSICIFLTLFFAVALAGCHTAKKSPSEFYEGQIGQLDTKKKGHDKNDRNHTNISKTRRRIVSEAKTWLGTPYSYGKAEKGKASDCSGMVMSVYQKVTGVKLPRNSARQAEFCKRLKKKDVKAGDLCFFATGKDPDRISHVGIMLDDKMFIHSSTSKGVVISDITQPYYVKTFKGFGRVPD